MFCKKCGSEIAYDVKFCPNCGNKTSLAAGELKEKAEKTIFSVIKPVEIEQTTERNDRNVVISFMSPQTYKIFFFGMIAIGIITLFSGVGILAFLLLFFVLKQKWAAKVKGFIIDYDKEIIFFPDCNVTYDEGFPGLKITLDEYRNGKEITFQQFKSVSGDFEREVKTDDSGKVHVNDFKVLNISTTFGSIRLKMRFNDSRFEKIAESLENVLEFKSSMTE